MPQAEPLPPPILGQPETFHERGLAAPFTTPAFATARVRASPKFELVLPNPSGGRGAYVLAWADIRKHFTPTVHDVRFCRRLAACERSLPLLLPTDIRRVAREVAQDGFAGRPAAAAANAAQRRTSFHEEAAKDRLAAAFAATGLEARRAAAAILDLACLYGDIGLGAQADAARVPVLIDLVSAVVGDLAKAAANRNETHRAARAMIASSGELTIALARRAMMAARQRGENAPSLLRDWASDRSALALELARPALLLDGWERVAALWREAGDNDHVLPELAGLVPPLPAELDSWFGLPGCAAAQTAMRRAASLTPPRGDGTLCDVVARNERLLALAA